MRATTSGWEIVWPEPIGSATFSHASSRRRAGTKRSRGTSRMAASTRASSTWGRSSRSRRSTGRRPAAATPRSHPRPQLLEGSLGVAGRTSTPRTPRGRRARRSPRAGRRAPCSSRSSRWPADDRDWSTPSSRSARRAGPVEARVALRPGSWPLSTIASIGAVSSAGCSAAPASPARSAPARAALLREEPWSGGCQSRVARTSRSRRAACALMRRRSPRPRAPTGPRRAGEVVLVVDDDQRIGTAGVDRRRHVVLPWPARPRAASARAPPRARRGAGRRLGGLEREAGVLDRELEREGGRELALDHHRPLELGVGRADRAAVDRLQERPRVDAERLGQRDRLRERLGQRQQPGVEHELEALAAPASPSHTVFAPTASKTGSTRSRTSSGPEASTSSLPCSAGCLVPEHRGVDERDAGRSARSREAVGGVEPDRAHLDEHGAVQRAERLARRPPRRPRASASMVTTTSAPATASATLPATVTPSPRAARPSRASGSTRSPRGRRRAGCAPSARP